METVDITNLWIEMLDRLKQTLPIQIYNTWIETSLIPYSFEDDVFTLDTTNHFICSFISKKYTNLLENTASSVINRPITVRLIHSSDNLSEEKSPKPVVSHDDSDNTYYLPEPDHTPVVDAASYRSSPDPADSLIPAVSVSITPASRFAETGAYTLNSAYTFDTFVIGNSNRLAHAAALAIAEAPAKKYNPFFIYGGSGLGKTHLMHAIGHYILEHFPHMRLRCITSEDFANELIQSIQDKSSESFRQRYRNIDILLVDDIQFLESKEHTQEEFFHTFNKLLKDHKQMVFTSDRPPQDIKKIEDRLRSRCKGGTVVSIEPPDLETRTAILRNRAKMENIRIQKEAIDYIASNVSENIRELEGAFIRAQMQASVEKSPITLELTQRALKELVSVKKEKKYITIDEIKKVAYPRQIAMYLCRELTDNTYPHIGTAFNGRDHTTVMHACTKISNNIKKDESFFQTIEQLKNMILKVDN